MNLQISIRTLSLSLEQDVLKSRGIDSEEELQAMINRLSVSIQRLKALIDGKEPPPEEPEVRSIRHLVFIPSFRYRDNSVHLPEWSPFWVGIFSLLLIKKTTMFTVLFRHAHSV